MLNPFITYKSHFVFLNSKYVKSEDYSVALGFFIFLGQFESEERAKKVDLDPQSRFDEYLYDWKKLSDNYENISKLIRK